MMNKNRNTDRIFSRHMIDICLGKFILAVLLFFSLTGYAQIYIGEKTVVYNIQQLNTKDSLIYKTSGINPEPGRSNPDKSSDRLWFTEKIRNTERRKKFSKVSSSKTTKKTKVLTRERITEKITAYSDFCTSTDRKYNLRLYDPDFEILNHRFRFDMVYSYAVFIKKLDDHFFRPQLPLNGQIIQYKSRYRCYLSIRPPPCLFFKIHYV
nr:hypothetical protein [uncultured Chryseobacterium sp.]